jgi:hypothetical protein
MENLATRIKCTYIFEIWGKLWARAFRPGLPDTGIQGKNIPNDPKGQM